MKPDLDLTFVRLVTLLEHSPIKAWEVAQLFVFCESCGWEGDALRAVHMTNHENLYFTCPSCASDLFFHESKTPAFFQLSQPSSQVPANLDRVFDKPSEFTSYVRGGEIDQD